MANVTNEFTRDPYGFLEDHPTACPSEFVGLRVDYMKFEYDEDLNTTQMRSAGAHEDRVGFYILGWKTNKASTGTLGSQASYFFTGPLTGCMFAVDKNWYSPRVIHVNQQLPSGRVFAHGMRATIASRMKDSTSWFDRSKKPKPNITVVESHNRNPEHRIAIFGWKGILGWTFVRQTTETNGMRWSVVSLETLDNWF